MSMARIRIVAVPNDNSKGKSSRFKPSRSDPVLSVASSHVTYPPVYRLKSLDASLVTPSSVS